MSEKKNYPSKYFIVFEGIDGSGTSTQAEMLANFFINSGQKAVVSPEPSNGKIGQLIRTYLGGENDYNKIDLFDQQMAYLFAADRFYHLYNNRDGVYELINQNIHVISTRYYFSSLAYNGKTEKDYQFISVLNQKFPPPDLVIYLDLPVELALERMATRSHKEIYETKDKLVQVQNRFSDIFANYNHHLLKIDAKNKPDEIHLKIISYLQDNLFR
ncbi:MAG: dTMP kinase [Cyanobacterium sp. T60_A2020_053]|nr:dTMP kinase [Cyanobacterium sp. T60_A2020_053]